MQLVVTHLRGAIVGPVDLTVTADMPAAITGPSGAGKSLLLRMIADLVPSDGEVRLGNMRRTAVDASDWRRAAIYVAAEAGWWADTAADHVPADARNAALVLAERLGLADGDLTRPIRMLSTGERQRLALVRALVREPKALLLDEPTSALDPDSVARVEALLRERAAAGIVLLLVSHDRVQAERLGAISYAMAAGRLSPS